MRIQYVVILVLMAGLLGCVKKSVHQDLQKRFDETTATLEASEARGQTLDEALTAEKGKVAVLEAKVAAVVGQLKKINDKLAKQKKTNADLDAKLASLIKDRAKLKASADELKRALAELKRRKAAADRRVAQFKNLLKRFQKLIDAGKLQVKIVDGRMVLVLPTDILFDSGSAKLSDAGVEAISEVAKILATMPKRKFQIEGHTDNVPIKTKRFKNNWELASARALGVVQAMVDAGMSPKVLSAASYGEYRPVANNKKKESRAANRRIDIVLVPNLSALPGFEDLKKAMRKK